MSVELTYRTHGTVVETLEGEFVSDDNATVTVDGMNTTQTLNASTTPPVTKHSEFTKALSSGSGSIDLTSLPDMNGVAAAVTFLGLKVQMVKFKNPSTNANAITITEGASNGHALLGASWTITLQPGQEIQFGNVGVDVGPDVASGDRTWDLTGTGSQVLQVEIVAG